MELVQVKGNTWYLTANFGLLPLYRIDDHRCIFLDSGWSWQREEFREALERYELVPVGAMASHAHEDHIGNHAWMKQTYGTKICMSFGEAVTVSTPIQLKAQFSGMSLNAVHSFAGDTIVQTDRPVGVDEEQINFMGVDFRIHHTPGHSVDHICIGTPDGVCYVGDLIMSGAVLETAKLPYHLVHTIARESMEQMRDVKGYTHFLATHYGGFTDIAAVVDQNIAHLDWICEQFLKLMEEPMTWEQVMMQVVERNQLYTKDEIKALAFEQNARYFMEYLRDTGKLKVTVDRGVLRYQRA